MTHQIVPRKRAASVASAASFCSASVAAIGGGGHAGRPRRLTPVMLGGSPAHAVEAVQPSAGFADLIARVKPAVISVRVKIEQDDQTVGSGMQQQQFGDNEQPAAKSSSASSACRTCRTCRQGTRKQFITGQGSGFFISADGYAVTNFHVVDHAKTVQVQTDDGKTYTAKVVGTDQKTDLALIKVDADKDFPFVAFADKAPRVGDWVVAVGNPFGLAGTATAGIVSARGRDIGAGPYDDFIQIDAPINKGNSGGPTFDIDGNVVGGEHRDLLAVRRLGRHRLRHSGRNREDGGRQAQGQGLRRARLDRRARSRASPRASPKASA